MTDRLSRPLVVLSTTLALVLGAGTAADARRPLPAKCQGGYYVIDGNPLVPGASGPDGLVVDRGAVSTVSGCPSTHAKVFKAKSKKAGSLDLLVVKWPACGKLRRATLKASISADCGSVSGKFAAKGVKGRKVTARNGVPQELRTPWSGPLPPGAVFVSPVDFLDASKRTGFRLLSPTQAADDEAAAAAADAADQATLDAFAAAHPDRADFVSIGVDPADPDLQSSSDGNYRLVVRDVDGNPDTVVTQGPRYQRAVRARTIRTYPTQDNQLALYRQLYAFAHAYLDPTLPAPEDVAGESAEDLTARNRSLSAQSAAALDAAPLPGEDLPGSFPSRCSNEIGSGDGSDGSGYCKHLSNGLWLTATWPLKYFDTCVKKQGSRGTCVAFATTAGRELRVAQRYNRWFNLSEQHLYFTAKRTLQPADYGDGLDPSFLLGQLLSTGYQQPLEQDWDYNPSNMRADDGKHYTESCVGYTSAEQAFCSDTAHQGQPICMQQGSSPVCAVSAPAVGPTTVRSTSQPAELWDPEDPINALGNVILTLANQVPVLIGFDVVKTFSSPDNNGFIRYRFDQTKVCETKPIDPAVPDVTACEQATDCQCSEGGHAVLAVGYIPQQKLPEGTPQSTGGFLIIKNSWGCKADGGYYYLPAAWVRAFVDSARPVGDVEVLGPLPDQPTDNFAFPFTPAPPSIHIVEPALGDSFLAGQGIPFVVEGADYDYDQWVLLGPITWTSELDGQVGQGQSTVGTLTQGTHHLTATYTGRLGVTVKSTTIVAVGPRPADLPPTPLFAKYSQLPPDQCPGPCGGNGTCIVGFGEGNDPEDGPLRDDAHVRWYLQFDGGARQLGSTGASVGNQGKYIGCPRLCDHTFQFVLEVEDSHGQKADARRELDTADCVN